MNSTKIIVSNEDENNKSLSTPITNPSLKLGKNKRITNPLSTAPNICKNIIEIILRNEISFFNHEVKVKRGLISVSQNKLHKL